MNEARARAVYGRDPLNQYSDDNDNYTADGRSPRASFDGWAVGYADGEDCYLAPAVEQSERPKSLTRTEPILTVRPAGYRQNPFAASPTPQDAVRDHGYGEGCERRESLDNRVGRENRSNRESRESRENRENRVGRANNNCATGSGTKTRYKNGKRKAAASSGVKARANRAVDPVTAIIAQNVLQDEMSLRKNRRRRRRRLAVMLAIVSVFGFFSIYQYSVIVGLDTVIDGRMSTLSKIEASNKIAKDSIEKSIDLDDTRLKAESLFGLRMPEKSQMIYFQVPRMDHALIESPEEKSDDEGFFDYVIGQFNLFWERVAGGSDSTQDAVVGAKK